MKTNPSHLIHIALVVGMATLATGNSFWRLFNCGTIKEKLEANEEISKPSDVVSCISACFRESTMYTYEITADTCFTVLMQPYITKVLKKSIPTESEMQTCLNAKDRSNCKDTLLYFFAKLYTDSYSQDHYKRFAMVLYDSWAHNPNITRAAEEQNWHYRLGRTLSRMTFDSDEIKSTAKIGSPADPLQFPAIHDELRRHCYKNISDHDTKIFCRLRVIMTIVNKIRALGNEEEEGEHFQTYVQAVKSNFVPFSLLFDKSIASDIKPSTEREKALLLDEQLNVLADLSQSGNTQNMQKFLQFMPESYLLDKACKQKTFPVLGRRCCILGKVVEQLLIYSEMAEQRKKSGGPKAATINFSLNLRSAITELRGEEVFKMMLNTRYDAVTNQDETANLIEGKFDQLQNYFAKLQSFNMQKARADVDYVKGRIEYYQEKTKSAIQNVSEHAGGILKAAILAQSLEVTEKVIALAATIAEACNPFKAVFNGGTATDIMDATADLMTAISGLVHATALKGAWENVISTARATAEGFKGNSEFLSAVGRIVDKIKLTDFPHDDEFEHCKSTFLRLYNAYTPQVDRKMLEDLATYLDTSVEAGCSIIDGVSTSAANAYISKVKNELYCQKASVSINGLKAIFDEIYDFQFEFIESMATYLQSATGYQASKQMVTLTGKPLDKTTDEDKRRSELRANIIMAHTTYEMQKQGVIQSLCDFLEYKQGGRTPAVCKASTIDVPTLLSYIPRRCRSVNKYVSIPTTTSSEVQHGFINIKDLYSGKEVSFDIPGYDWMKQHRWINREGNFEAVYIENFEVFLPSASRGEKEIEVRVRSMGGNRFKNDGIKYSLIPGESYTVDYIEGERYNPCSGNKVENPYNICEDRKLPNLCVMNNARSFDDDKKLYPTTFARFKIRARGVTSAEAPDPETPLHIKAKLDLCIFEKDDVREKRSGGELKEGCCSGNDYWNEERSACEACAAGTTSNLNGYYCEKNRNALARRKKRKHSSRK